MSRPTSSVPSTWRGEAGRLQPLGMSCSLGPYGREALREDRGDQDDPERGRGEPEDRVAPHQAASERMRGSSAA